MRVPLSDIPVNPYTASELVRLCLRRQDVEDQSTSNVSADSDLDEEVVRVRRLPFVSAGLDYFKERRLKCKWLVKCRSLFILSNLWRIDFIVEPLVNADVFLFETICAFVLCISRQEISLQDAEIIQQLETQEFFSLDPVHKVHILKGLCLRIMGTYSVQDYMEEKQQEATKLWYVVMDRAS